MKVNVQRRDKGAVRPTRDEDLGDDTVAPAADVCETDTGWLLLADMPGVAKEQLEVQVERGVLTISGQFGTPPPEGREIYQGFQRPDYFRSLALSDEVDRANITANLTSGVLTIVLPRAQAAETKKIVVEPGE